jgi:hypothetical protein
LLGFIEPSSSRFCPVLSQTDSYLPIGETYEEEKLGSSNPNLLSNFAFSSDYDKVLFKLHHPTDQKVDSDDKHVLSITSNIVIQVFQKSQKSTAFSHYSNDLGEGFIFFFFLFFCFYFIFFFY